MAAALASVSFSGFAKLTERSASRTLVPSSNAIFSSSGSIRWRTVGGVDQIGGVSRSFGRPSVSVIRCSVSMAADIPTVAETKLDFIKAYKRPIPNIYSNVIQELIVQQHLMRYKATYRYDPVFALGFVTVYDQLMDGYPSDEDREAIFRAYINALKEDPEQYRNDAKKMEEWASSQNASSIVEFLSRDGEVEGILKDIAERAKEKKFFSYSRFFAIGLFRLLEQANATEPAVLDKRKEKESGKRNEPKN
ncbi:protein THYLAKOID FORMATION1, chloroplastic isoform X2 [Cryptomeria japonica]|uniref:protein THYLAKOID FORMATION1, chloroplastic isoform X2 n=1 Tax=Cryptomeria japonica TaxID=3369 RepID=UPI0027DA279E|nr:protein THYLAKOID FORMATION1, chloroplastic isoform X2 [Cryptomeria japonica]